LQEYFDLGGRWKDAFRDFTADRLSLPFATMMAITDPMLALLTMSDVPGALARGACPHGQLSLDGTISALALSVDPTPATSVDPDAGRSDHDSSLSALAHAFVPTDVERSDVATPGVSSVTTPTAAPPDIGTQPLRAAVLALTAELHESAPGSMTTVSSCIDAMTGKIDAALEALSPHQPDLDVDAMLVASAMADAPFSDHASPLVPAKLKDPTNMAEYNAAPDRLEFREAMHTEAYQLLDKYNTLEHPSKDTIDEYRAAGRVVRVVPSKGVWKRKYTSNATVAFDRHKWRWCACEAVGRSDVQNTYSPAVSIESVRLLFTIAAIHGLGLCSVDVGMWLGRWLGIVLTTRT